MNLPAEIPAGVTILLNILRPLVVKAARDEFSNWEHWFIHGPQSSLVLPEVKSHVESLRIWGHGSSPLMEVHDLGDFEKGPVLDSRVGDIFNYKEDTYVAHCLVFNGFETDSKAHVCPQVHG